MFGGKKKVSHLLRVIAVILLILGSKPVSFAQTARVTFYEHIEPIIRQNCTPCHRPGQAGPFNLITFEDVSKKGEFIARVTKDRYMPPWKADLSFQQYRNARSLTDTEINLIQSWVLDGMPKGKAPKKAKYHDDQLPFDKPDLSLKVAEPYNIPTTGTDDFRFFNVQSGLNSDKFIRKVEFLPGNKRLVHHSRLMTDTTHKVRDIHGLSASDPRVNQFEKYPPVDKFLYEIGRAHV